MVVPYGYGYENGYENVIENLDYQQGPTSVNYKL